MISVIIKIHLVRRNFQTIGSTDKDSAPINIHGIRVNYRRGISKSKVLIVTRLIYIK